MRRRYRVLFHLSSSDAGAFSRMISNMYNLLKDLGESGVEVVMVANGEGVGHFLKSSMDEATSRRLSRLRELGVKFYVCGNSLRARGIKEEEVDDTCEIVPVGITLLVRLQSEGYAYVKP